jgi:FKBP-type peptidyl-prolyl cis-trans isomerase
MLRLARRTGLALPSTALRACLAALVATVAACNSVEAPNEDPANTSYAPALGVNIAQMTRTADGLYYQDITTGTGATADSGKTVRVYYTGWLTSGEQFDTNRNKTPFEFVLGTGSVIKGWDEGLKAMRVGGRRRLVIPPELAYGGKTSGLIPAGSVLVFDVELVSATGGTTTTTTSRAVPEAPGATR